MIQMKAVVPGADALKQVQAVQDEWKKALQVEGKADKAEYDKTHKTWDTDVDFKIEEQFGPDEWYVETSTVNRIYWFVHESVAVMRAVLSPDWSPKTQPRVLDSGAGSGKKLYASKKISKPPYPAREFTEKIIEVRQPKFQKAMEKATRDGVKKAP